MFKLFITSPSFGIHNKNILKKLEDANIDYKINKSPNKLSEQDLLDILPNYNGIIAGTEQLSSKVINHAKNLKIISRIGVGLNNVDLIAAKKNDIIVCYTPNAPTSAILDLTLAFIFSLLRSVHLSNLEMHNGNWTRIFGRSISDVSIGVIGLGRVGKLLIEKLNFFELKRDILIYDINKNVKLNQDKVSWAEKHEIYSNCDIISIHLPLTNKTKNMISKKELLLMKKDSMLINTSRGGIINEKDLFEVMSKGHLSGVALDVFEKEPYSGPLSKIPRCLLTSHIGSMSIEARSRMELDAVEAIINFVSKKQIQNQVPEIEYSYQVEEGLS